MRHFRQNLEARWAAFASSDTRPPWYFVVAILGALYLMREHLFVGGVAHRMSRSGEMSMWVCMVVAMMLPFLGPSLNSLRLRVFPRHRDVASVSYVLAWLFPWLLLGIPLVFARQFDATHHALVPGAAFLLAACWHLSARHARGLVCGFRVVPPPELLAMIHRCLIEGVRSGFKCVASCGPLMLACALANHHPVAMFGGLALTWVERSSYRPSSRLASGLAAAIGFFFLGTLSLSAPATPPSAPTHQCH